MARRLLARSERWSRSWARCFSRPSFILSMALEASCRLTSRSLSSTGLSAAAARAAGPLIASLRRSSQSIGQIFFGSGVRLTSILISTLARTR